MTPIRIAPMLAVALLGISVAAAQQASAPAESTPVGMILMTHPEEFGDLERPPVNFNHARHTTTLGVDHCQDCHLVEEGVLTPSFAAAAGDLGPEALMDAYHDGCRACHQERAEQGLSAGPLTCGECHRRNNAVLPDQAPMAYDYSLHARHVAVFKERDEKDQCRDCHHVWDEELKQLVYVKGQEDACSDCHLEKDEGKTLSLKNASHVQCLSCHLDRVARAQKAGPTTCVGCHDPVHRQAIEQLEEIPRLLRGQPDQMWIHRADGLSRLVPFDHSAHEPRAVFCTSCHHLTVQPCSTCHTVAGAPEGGGVTLEGAYHGASSPLSCVGCHQVAQGATGCVGCHGGLAASSTGSACSRCHSGLWLAPGIEPPAAVPNTAGIAQLPAASDDFPEKVKIEVLADEYQASEMPHLKIVARLDAPIRASGLARQFHGTVEAMCAGCHHHSPAGERPPRCSACHGEAAAATKDKPDLKAAYHRQCIGCHIEMNIQKQGCTDCHAEKEVAS